MTFGGPLRAALRAPSDHPLARAALRPAGRVLPSGRAQPRIEPRRPRAGVPLRGGPGPHRGSRAVRHRRARGRLPTSSKRSGRGCDHIGQPMLTITTRASTTGGAGTSGAGRATAASGQSRIAPSMRKGTRPSWAVRSAADAGCNSRVAVILQRLVLTAVAELVPNLVPDSADLTLESAPERRLTWLYPARNERQGANHNPRVGGSSPSSGIRKACICAPQRSARLPSSRWVPCRLTASPEPTPCRRRRARSPRTARVIRAGMHRERRSCAPRR